MKKPRKTVPVKVYDHATIEKKWQKKWAAMKVYKAQEIKSARRKAQDKYYVLDMFPYPSGEGLHVGHPKGYIATDIVSRMKRMQGMNVLHPMGFDAFGLPAENYALKTKTNPEVAVRKNVTRYKKQLEILGFDYDWSREVNTTDPQYYRWTQWIFLQLLKKGLAHESYEPVNWCPTDKTVLANEDIENGRCERCGTPVEKKILKQWVLEITKYADRLLDDLDATDYVRPRIVDKTNPHRPGAPLVKRRVAHAIVYDPHNKKYLIIRNKKHGWDTVVIGGIEGNESPVETARREVREETGYTDLTFKRILGGETESHYFTKHKGDNRIAFAQAVYFELASDARVPRADGEDKDDEILWIDGADFVPGKMVNSELPIWLERLKDPTKGFGKPLLDWPESIKEAQRNWIGRSEGAEIDFRLALTTHKPRFVIVHGYTGSPRDDFMPWLKAELEARGHEVEVPELPNTKEPNESEQVDYVLKNCRIDERTVIIGHSLGAIVAMKAVQKLNKPISGLVVVAAAIDPAFPSADPRPYAKNFSWNIDYDRIRTLAGGRIAVLSDMEEHLRGKYLKFLADKLQASLTEVKAQEKHFVAVKEPAVLKAVTPIVSVFTTRPDTLYGVTYVVLAPEHPWVKELLNFTSNRNEIEAYIAAAARATEIERTAADREKTGVELKGVKAVNPVNGDEVPVWIADYVLADYGTGAVMAVPAHDERDYAFAKKFGLPIREVVSGGDVNKEAFIGTGNLVNSASFTGKDSETVKKEISAAAGGRWVTKYKLRDWVFSRQRYWGEPIPVIHCPEHGVVPVPEKDLPVVLPKVKSYEPTGTGESPLAAISKWVNVKCPICKGPARRETNTMPQWAGSCWYYLRYMDPRNHKELVARSKEKYWSPVDLYIGGAEHATRHLIYARFWHKSLYDIGVVSTIEPFTRLQSVGLIMGEDGRKMSKRFGNVVNPDEIVGAYGADTMRIYEMFMGPFDQAIPWSTDSIVGARRFVERVWKLREKVGEEGRKDRATGKEGKNDGKTVKSAPLEGANVPAAPATASAARIINKAVKKITDDIQNLRFNTAVSSLMIALNELEKIANERNEKEQAGSVSRADFESFLKLLAPFAPHVTEELWMGLGNKKSIHVSSWPVFDPALARDEEVRIIVQVNGKVRGAFIAAAGTGKSELEAAARGVPELKKWLDGKKVGKIIVVPDRLVNIVLTD